MGFLASRKQQYRPFRERVFGGISAPKIDTASDPDLSEKSQRPAQYRATWDNRSMKLAVEAVVFGYMSLSRAAETYNIPKSTLYDHKKGKSFPGVKSGHPTLLSEEEEEDLVSFLIECSEIGYPKTRLEVIAIAERMIRVKGKEEQCPNYHLDGGRVLLGVTKNCLLKLPHVSQKHVHKLQILRA